MTRQINITATIFGGSSDRERSAYDGHIIGNAELCCSLPSRFSKPPKVRVFHNGKSAVGAVEDIGPWNVHDPYWQTGKRPQAESGRDLFGRRTNHAGIDLSPALARAIGIGGMGTVDWEFADAEPPPPAPMIAPPSGLIRQTWPHENMHDLCAFYGDPRGRNGVNPAWESANLIHVVPPWRMNASRILVHKKCADSLMRVLAFSWEHIGKDQAKIDACHLNVFDGSFNYRTIRGSSNLSMHAFGIALDFAAAWNPLGSHWHDGGNMLPRWFIDAFLEEGWSWGGMFHGRTDPMHFEATNLGQHPLIA